MALAERQADGATWRVFSGNEIGTLLGCWQWEMFQKFNPQGQKAAVVCSTVSSKMLRAVAQAEGFEFHETLTGRLVSFFFCWVEDGMSRVLPFLEFLAVPPRCVCRPLGPSLINFDLHLGAA